MQYTFPRESLTFIELANFTKYVYTYLSEDEYRGLQDHLIQHPESGVVIPNSGGCRKLRWRAEGRGKRGGVRVIYFYRTARGRIYLLIIYAKNEVENIPAHILRKYREEIDRG
jgi:hypothetical protein